MNTADDCRLVVNQVGKQYGKKTALSGVSFEVGPGLYGFLGPNGAGKSTLFGIISGYIHQYTGSVLIPEVSQLHPVRVGVLPQAFSGYGEMKVGEFLLYMASIKAPSVPREEAVKDMNEKLSVFHLTEKKNMRLRTLSGGQLRRLGIAQAFQYNPAVVLLDEPTTGLDPEERISFKNYVAEQSEKEIILLSTHIVSDLEESTKEIFIMNNGRLLLSGQEEELLAKVRGKVFFVTAPSETELYRKVGSYKISSLSSDGELRARVVTDGTVPCPGAAPVQADLNDVYIYTQMASGHQQG